MKGQDGGQVKPPAQIVAVHPGRKRNPTIFGIDRDSEIKVPIIESGDHFGITVMFDREQADLVLGLGPGPAQPERGDQNAAQPDQHGRPGREIGDDLGRLARRNVGRNAETVQEIAALQSFPQPAAIGQFGSLYPRILQWAIL